MKKLWELIILMVIGTWAVSYAVGVIKPLLPIIMGTAVLGAVGVVVYKRRRRW